MEENYLKKTKESLPTLTKGMKKVADYLIVEPMLFATHPAKKVGKMIGVSETMVIRFSNAIGYTGYSSLQNEIRKSLLNLSQNSLKELDVEESRDDYAESMIEDINNLKSYIDKLESKNYESFVEAVIGSEKLVIAGYYHSFTFAHWFYFNLNYMLDNVSLYRPETDAGVLDFLPKKSSIVIFSFFRYALDTLRLAEEAKDKGIKVIAMTDSHVSPVTEFADIIIPINMKNKDLFSKGPVTLSVINAILYKIIQRIEDKGKIPETYKYFIKGGEN